MNTHDISDWLYVETTLCPIDVNSAANRAANVLGPLLELRFTLSKCIFNLMPELFLRIFQYMSSKIWRFCLFCLDNASDF